MEGHKSSVPQLSQRLPSSIDSAAHVHMDVPPNEAQFPLGSVSQPMGGGRVGEITAEVDEVEEEEGAPLMRGRVIEATHVIVSSASKGRGFSPVQGKRSSVLLTLGVFLFLLLIGGAFLVEYRHHGLCVDKPEWCGHLLEGWAIKNISTATSSQRTTTKTATEADAVKAAPFPTYPPSRTSVPPSGAPNNPAQSVLSPSATGTSSSSKGEVSGTAEPTEKRPPVQAPDLLQKLLTNVAAEDPKTAGPIANAAAPKARGP